MEMTKQDIDKMFDNANVILDAFTEATDAIVSVKDIIENNEEFKPLVAQYNNVRETIISFVVLLGIVTLVEPAEIVAWITEEDEDSDEE